MGTLVAGGLFPPLPPFGLVPLAEVVVAVDDGGAGLFGEVGVERSSFVGAAGVVNIDEPFRAGVGWAVRGTPCVGMAGWPVWVSVAWAYVATCAGGLPGRICPWPVTVPKGETASAGAALGVGVGVLWEVDMILVL